MLILTHTCKSQFYLLPEPGNYQKKKKVSKHSNKNSEQSKTEGNISRKVYQWEDTFLEIGNGLWKPITDERGKEAIGVIRNSSKRSDNREQTQPRRKEGYFKMRRVDILNTGIQHLYKPQ